MERFFEVLLIWIISNWDETVDNFGAEGAFEIPITILLTGLFNCIFQAIVVESMKACSDETINNIIFIIYGLNEEVLVLYLGPVNYGSFTFSLLMAQ